MNGRLKRVQIRTGSERYRQRGDGVLSVNDRARTEEADLSHHPTRHIEWVPGRKGGIALARYTVAHNPHTVVSNLDRRILLLDPFCEDSDRNALADKCRRQFSDVAFEAP